MKVNDLDKAFTAAWKDLADAEGEHDAAHAEHAVAELVRLNQITVAIPQQR